jgi:hypothetical protein
MKKGGRLDAVGVWKGLNMPKQHMEHLGQFINGYDASTK